MHTVLGKILKYVLRALLALILLYMGIGLAKSGWNLSTYVHMLDAKDRNTSWSQMRGSPSSWGVLFWEDEATVTTGIDLLSGADSLDLTGMDMLSGEELSLSGMEAQTTGFGFTQEDLTNPSATPADDAKAALLNVIKQRELKE